MKIGKNDMLYSISVITSTNILRLILIRNDVEFRRNNRKADSHEVTLQRLYREIRSIEDAHSLQQVFFRLQEWADKWQM